MSHDVEPSAARPDSSPVWDLLWERMPWIFGTRGDEFEPYENADLVSIAIAEEWQAGMTAEQWYDAVAERVAS